MKSLTAPEIEALCRRILGVRFGDLARMVHKERALMPTDSILFGVVHDLISLPGYVPPHILVTAIGRIAVPGVRPDWLPVLTRDCPPGHIWLIVQMGKEHAFGPLRDIPVREHSVTEGTVERVGTFPLIVGTPQ